MTHGDFEGGVAIVTGAAGAVGGHVVRLLHDAGASFVAGAVLAADGGFTAP